jgi:cobalamin synthase
VNPSVQTILALVIVALAAGWLIWRAFAKKKAGGCGGDCGCASSDLKRQLEQKH